MNRRMLIRYHSQHLDHFWPYLRGSKNKSKRVRGKFKLESILHVISEYLFF